MASMFPDFTQSVPTAPLLVIDYNLVVQKNLAEVSKLFEASTELGFFYLKLDNQLDPTPMFTLAEKLFKLPLDIKMKYVMDSKNGAYFGYKAIGSMFSDRRGTPDKIEFWNISKDEIIVQDSAAFPKPIIDAKSIVKEYMIKSHEIVLVILQALSANLVLGSQALPDLHRLMAPSGDQLRFTKSTLYPTGKECSPDVALGAHTDFGSVTILFNQLWGLQVLAPSGEWLYVRPLLGHAIVNLGDSMVKFSDGIIKSNIHRVIRMPRLREETDRYSVVYFARPENNVQMKSLMNNGNEKQGEEHVFTAQEWIARRVKNFQTVNYKDEKTYEMSRGTEEQREPDVSM